MTNKITLSIGYGEVPDIPAPEDEVYEGQKVLLMAVFDKDAKVGGEEDNYKDTSKVTYEWDLKNGLGTVHKYDGCDSVKFSGNQIQVIKVWDTSGIKPGIYSARVKVTMQDSQTTTLAAK